MDKHKKSSPFGAELFLLTINISWHEGEIM